MKGMLLLPTTCLLMLLVAEWIPAQEGSATKADGAPKDPTVTTWTREKIDNPPAREMKIAVQKKTTQRKLPRADAKLLEHKYSALVQLRLPKARREIDVRSALNDAELRELVRFGNNWIIFAGIRPSTDRTQLESLKAYRERTPKARWDKLHDADFFTSEDVDQGYLSFDFLSTNQMIAQFHILARTERQAEQRAQDLLVILDLAVARPLQLALLERRTRVAAQYRTQQASLTGAEAELARLKGQLQELSGPSSPLLGLQLQQFQLDVDVAGATARLAACEARLQEEGANQKNAQLEALKVTAEIELVGYNARREVLNQHQQQVSTRQRAAEELGKAQTAVNNLKNDIWQTRRMLDELQKELDDYQPLSLEGGTVSIQPIEWTR